MTFYADYSELETWISFQEFLDLAAEIRTTSASVEEATEPIGYTWADLRPYFVTSSLHNNDPFFSAGWAAAICGRNVAKGGDNIATFMEECAVIVSQLELERKTVIREAKRINYCHSVPRTTESGKACVEALRTHTPETDWHGFGQNESEVILEDIRNLSKRYKEALQDLADKIKALKDDGNTQNLWGGRIMDTVLQAGSFVGVYIAPVGVAATGIQIARNYTGAYRDQQRELLEDHPDWSDSQISSKATKYAAFNGTVESGLDLTVGKLTGPLMDEVADGTPMGEKTKDAVGEVVKMGGYAVVDVVTPEATSPSPDIRVVPDPDYAAQDAAQQEAVEAAREASRIKDYDGDGFTDTPFLPDSSYVEDGLLAPATEVRDGSPTERATAMAAVYATNPIEQIATTIGAQVQVIQAGQAVADSVFGSGTQAVQIPVGLQTPVVPDVLAPRPEYGPPAPVVYGPPAPTVSGPPAPTLPDGL